MYCIYRVFSTSCGLLLFSTFFIDAARSQTNSTQRLYAASTHSRVDHRAGIHKLRNGYKTTVKMPVRKKIPQELQFIALEFCTYAETCNKSCLREWERKAQKLAYAEYAFPSDIKAVDDIKHKLQNTVARGTALANRRY
jgi:hypothetical protein